METKNIVNIKSFEEKLWHYSQGYRDYEWDIEYGEIERMFKIIDIVLNNDSLPKKYNDIRKYTSGVSDLNLEFEFLKESENASIKVFRRLIGRAARILRHFDMHPEEKKIIPIPKEKKDELRQQEKKMKMQRNIIESYISYTDSVYTTDFLNAFGIVLDDFLLAKKACAKDNELMKRLKETEQTRQMQRKEDTIGIARRLYNGLLSGKTEDGNEFDDVEFFATLPRTSGEVFADFGLKNIPYLNKKISRIVQHICGDNKQIVLEIGNRFGVAPGVIPNTTTTLSEDDILKLNILSSSDGKAPTKKEKEKIIKYMKARNIPFITRAYAAVLKKFLDGNLKIDMYLKEEEKEQGNVKQD